MASSGLMQDRQSRYGIEQGRNNPRHHLVEDALTLATAKDQQMRRVTQRSWLQREKLLAYRTAGYRCISEILARRSEAYRRRAHSLANEPICQPGCGIRFKGQRGDASQQSGDHSRPRSVATHTDDNIGAKCVEDFETAPQPKRQIQQGPQPRGQADAL